MKSVGLALGSGGARGMAHIPVLLAFDELNIKPKIIAGSSIGAIIGAIYASGVDAQGLVKIVQGLNLLEISKMMDIAFFHRTGIVRGEKITRFLKSIVEAETFEDLKIPLKVAATDFWNRRRVIIESGDLVSAIRASMSIPGFFEPVVRDGAVLIDGGVCSPIPFDILHGCDITVAVNVTPRRLPRSPGNIFPTVLQSTMEAVDIAQTVIIRQMLKTQKPNILFTPNLINVEVMDFHRAREILDESMDEKERIKPLLKKALRSFFPFYHAPSP